MEEYIDPDTSDSISPSDYDNYKYKKNNRDEAFIKELNELPFGEDIRNEAFVVYKGMNSPIKRKDNRQYMKFFCIYNAYRNLGKNKDVNELARSCKIDPSQLSKIFKMFSENKTGYRMKDVEITPLNYIHDYYAQTELRMDEIDKLITFTKDILDKEDFCDEYPQVVMAGIIVYYLQNINNIIPPSKFYKYIETYESGVKKISQKVGAVYNS